MIGLKKKIGRARGTQERRTLKKVGKNDCLGPCESKKGKKKEVEIEVCLKNRKTKPMKGRRYKNSRKKEKTKGLVWRGTKREEGKK